MSIKDAVSGLDDLDLRLVRAWSGFRSKVGEFINNVDECTVELQFESSLDSHTHFTFDPDEAVFISDIEVSNNNQVTFVVPHGSKTKTFFPSEAELINAKQGDTTKPLSDFITEIYKE